MGQFLASILRVVNPAVSVKTLHAAHGLRVFGSRKIAPFALLPVNALAVRFGEAKLPQAFSAFSFSRTLFRARYCRM